MSLTRAPGFCLFRFSLSLSLSLSHTHTHTHSLSLSLSLETCTSFFSSPSPPFAPRPPSSRPMSYQGLAALQQRSHLGSRSAGDVSVALTKKTGLRQEKESETSLKENRKTGKGNCPPGRESGVSRSLKTRPQISMVILGSLWFWRHEFLWRHFSRSLCTRFL